MHYLWNRGSRKVQFGICGPTSHWELSMAVPPNALADLLMDAKFFVSIQFAT